MLIVLLIIWAACAYIGHRIGQPKGYPYAGLILGFFLGLIGIIIILWMPSKTPPPSGPQAPPEGQQSSWSPSSGADEHLAEHQRLFGQH